jgi:hypothetical protein
MTLRADNGSYYPERSRSTDLSIGDIVRVLSTSGYASKYHGVLIEILEIDRGIYGDDLPRHIKGVPVPVGRWGRSDPCSHARWFNARDVETISPLELLAEQAND